MPRFTIEDGPISVAFGYEDDPWLAGVFLTVCDKRLEYDGDASKKVNAVSSHVDSSGSGFYLSLNTNAMEIGLHVDDTTMAVYLKRYGVSQHQIDRLPLQVPKLAVAPSSSNSPRCSLCRKPSARSRCSKCKSVLYCSTSCQKSDWPVHSIFCKLAPLPALESSGDFVQAVLMAEKSEAPILLRVQRELHDDGEDGLYKTLDSLGIGSPGRVRSDCNPRNPLSDRQHALVLIFRDTFMTDGSAPNACIAHVLSKASYPAGHWRGPVLVMKVVRGQENHEYLDLNPSEGRDIVEFLHAYNLAVLTVPGASE